MDGEGDRYCTRSKTAGRQSLRYSVLRKPFAGDLPKRKDLWSAAMKVSIGLPFYNNRATLGDAIRSVFSQTFSDWELILVDDGSTDGSLELAQGLCDSRVRVFRDGINRGLPARLNQIAGLARGHYLARMDGDDLMHPERLAHQVEVLDRNKDAELAGTAIFSLDRSGRPRGMRGVAHPDSSPLGVLKGVPLVHATLMARTDWFRL